MAKQQKGEKVPKINNEIDCDKNDNHDDYKGELPSSVLIWEEHQMDFVVVWPLSVGADDT